MVKVIKNKPMTITSKLLVVLSLGSADVSSLYEARLNVACSIIEGVTEALKMEHETLWYTDLENVR